MVPQSANGGTANRLTLVPAGHSRDYYSIEGEHIGGQATP